MTKGRGKNPIPDVAAEVTRLDLSLRLQGAMEFRASSPRLLPR